MTAHASGCPHCGVDRLKSAPVPLIDGVLKVLTSRRRYRCSACGWSGWRHRLRRRRDDVPSLAPRQTPTGRAVGFFVWIVVFLLVSGVLLMRACGPTTTTRVEGSGTP